MNVACDDKEGTSFFYIAAQFFTSYMDSVRKLVTFSVFRRIVSNCRKSLNDFNCTSRKSGRGIGFLTLPKFTLLSITFEAIKYKL